MSPLGIVGLPNVGKSTLFNALTKNNVLAANYPFATIQPNVGIVALPDPRLAKLAELYKTEKVVPATVTFVDIAGIVRGASEGQGMGNKFLSHIRPLFNNSYGTTSPNFMGYFRRANCSAKPEPYGTGTATRP